MSVVVVGGRCIDVGETWYLAAVCCARGNKIRHAHESCKGALEVGFSARLSLVRILFVFVLSPFSSLWLSLLVFRFLHLSLWAFILPSLFLFFLLPSLLSPSISSSSSFSCFGSSPLFFLFAVLPSLLSLTASVSSCSQCFSAFDCVSRHSFLVLTSLPLSPLSLCLCLVLPLFSLLWPFLLWLFQHSTACPTFLLLHSSASLLLFI